MNINYAVFYLLIINNDANVLSNPFMTFFSVHNTLYLEVHCPVVKPTLVVISDNGKSTLDYGEVSLGQNIIKSVTIQNISNKTVEVNVLLCNKICINIWLYTCSNHLNRLVIYYIALFCADEKCAVNFADTEFYFVLIINEYHVIAVDIIHTKYGWSIPDVECPTSFATRWDSYHSNIIYSRKRRSGNLLMAINWLIYF